MTKNTIKLEVCMDQENWLRRKINFINMLGEDRLFTLAEMREAESELDFIPKDVLVKECKITIKDSDSCVDGLVSIRPVFHGSVFGLAEILQEYLRYHDLDTVLTMRMSVQSSMDILSGKVEAVVISKNGYKVLQTEEWIENAIVDLE